MKQTFEVENVKCDGCANTLRKKLLNDFGEIEVNLSVLPRQITLDIKDEDIDKLKETLKSMGYPMSSEKLDTIDNITTKAKSFISCATGKFDK
ncbi:putative heavy metal transport/detoxification protein [Sulfurovum sp. enrichment culture clone C5]|uniref:Putative heavy metal transport/detoxification protein n=1 Tax=Sulfurovum sp. enrichment culture clone C5 TaxID=497650 RepID=A0A0S4XQ15_9BACT|nr:putative heavy metal transport/detoxification protein [Sulfurovum sp. enrichment culture clone C5]